MATAATPLATARALLNDQSIAGGSLWTNAVLLPYLAEAHRELVVKLDLAGVPVIISTSAQFDVAAADYPSLALTGALAGLIKPEWMKEKTVGDLDSNFTAMTEISFIPTLDRTDRLNYWCWQEEVIKLRGATAARTVLVGFWKSLTVISTDTSPIGFIYGENYLGHRTAALVAQSLGNLEWSQIWTNEANSKWDEIRRMNIKGMQGLPGRRRAYHRRRGVNRFAPGL